jgi:hypothetical protein
MHKDHRQKTYKDYLKHLKRAVRAHSAQKLALNTQESTSVYLCTREGAPLLLKAIAASPKAYNDWKKDEEDMPGVDVVQTGIPELVKEMMLRATQANHKATSLYLRRALAPMLVRFQTLVDGFSVREHSILRDRRKLGELLMLCYGHPAQLRDIVKEGYLSKAKKLMIPLNGSAEQWESDIVNTVNLMINNLGFQSFSKLIRRHGVLTPNESKHRDLKDQHTNWNQDIT